MRPFSFHRFSTIGVTLCSLLLIHRAIPIASRANAETLEGLNQSRVMEDFDRKQRNLQRKVTNKTRNDWVRGMDSNTDYASLWMSSHAPMQLLDWAGARLPYYKPGRPTSIRKPDHILAIMPLSNNKRIEVEVLIIVPHPNTWPLVDTNVLPLIRQYGPPVLEVAMEKDIKLKGATGKYYEAKNGSCSVVVKLAQRSLLNVSTKECKDSSTLIDVAQQLDLDRLNRKLDS